MPRAPHDWSTWWAPTTTPSPSSPSLADAGRPDLSPRSAGAAGRRERPRPLHDAMPDVGFPALYDEEALDAEYDAGKRDGEQLRLLMAVLLLLIGAINGFVLFGVVNVAALILHALGAL